MFRNRFLAILLILWALVSLPAAALAATDTLIIETTSDIDSLATEVGATVMGRIPTLNLYRISAETSVLTALQSDSRITATYTDSQLDARPSYFIGTSDILAADATDSIVAEQYTEQAAVQTLRVSQAQSISTGSGIIVAVIDTGAESDHPLLADKLVAGYDFVDDDNSPEDVASGLDTDDDGSIDDAAGHGSHVAGIVALVAPDAKVMPIRVLDTNGRGVNFVLAQAMVYAVDQGADVINLSGNSGTDETFVQAAVDYAWSRGVVVVTSAGLNQIGYPASYSNAISVGSTNDDGYRTVLSNFGDDEVSVYAPGELIMSAYHGGRYARWTGHSMATPFVSGLAALMLATGSCDNQCVRDELLSYARWVDRHIGGEANMLPDFYDAVGAAANQQHLAITVQSRMTPDEAPDNNVRKIQIKLNSTAHSVPLDELTIRYWYSNENSAEEEVTCDWAAVGCSNLDTTFGIESRSVEQWQYLEIAFSAEAGNLYGADSSGEIHLRTNHTDWSNYDETDDYSYHTNTDFTDWDKIGLYHNGELIAGRAPTESATSAITLTETTATHNTGQLTGVLLISLLLTGLSCRLYVGRPIKQAEAMLQSGPLGR